MCYKRINNLNLIVYMPSRRYLISISCDLRNIAIVLFPVWFGFGAIYGEFHIKSKRKTFKIDI